MPTIKFDEKVVLELRRMNEEQRPIILEFQQNNSDEHFVELVFGVVLTNDTENGAYFPNVFKQTGLANREILLILTQLANEGNKNILFDNLKYQIILGYIYSTVDEEHYKSTE